jgi:hypothetical protein
MNKKSLDNFKKLCENFRAFSWSDLNRSNKYYCDGKVWCYFADGHSAVYIDYFELHFHSTPRIQFPIHRLGEIEAVTKKYQKKLNELIEERETRSIQAKKDEKEAAIKDLEKRLSELKETSCKKEQ